jgi:glucose/arabinose dehydrogenase
MRRTIYLTIMVCLFLASCSSSTGTSNTATTPVTTADTSSQASDTLVDTGSAGIPGIKLPPGFHISVYASGLRVPRFMTIGPKGALLVANRAEGTIVAYPAGSTEEKAGNSIIVVSNLQDPTSLVMYEGNLYVGEASSIARMSLGNDLKAGAITRIITDLPEGGQHSTRTVLIGADKHIYVASGSDCNVCQEQDPHRAAVWKYNLDGTQGQLYSKGLRNAVGLATNPWTGTVWASNNGRDLLGDDIPPETINELSAGADFGWPRCHAGNVADPQFGQGSNACQGVQQPLVKMQAHSAPLGLEFYPQNSTQFPTKYQNNLYVAFHGSWNRSTPTGYKIVRIPLQDGKVSGPVEDFAVGWLTSDGKHSGRPTGITFGEDGSMFVSDDEQGEIYHIWYHV